MIPAASSLSKRYDQLTVPVVIIAGGADKVVDPDKHARRLHGELQDSELHVLPGLGHMVHYFARDDVVSALTTEQALDASARPDIAANSFA